MARSWGPWTEVKLDALRNYLAAFTLASSRARGTLYFDLFAGAAENESRRDHRRIVGSPLLAAGTTPAFSKLVLCELQQRHADQLRQRIAQEHPGLDVEVLGGDCNETIPVWLARADPGWRYAPAFAFLDQYAAEISWATIESLAKYKAADRTKVELWILFADGLVPRGAYGGIDGPVLDEFATRMDEMFGTRYWRVIRRGRVDGLLAPADFRAELVNLMRWRLEKDLHYRTTLPLSFVNERGTPLYTMIFATDHDVGSRIMKSVFAGAERALEDMQSQARIRRKREREEERGVYALFDDPGSQTAASVSPTFQAPRLPWEHPSAGEDR